MFTLNMYVVFASNPFTKIILSDPIVGRLPIAGRRFEVDYVSHKEVSEALISVAKGFPGLLGVSSSTG